MKKPNVFDVLFQLILPSKWAQFETLNMPSPCQALWQTNKINDFLTVLQKDTNYCHENL